MKLKFFARSDDLGGLVSLPGERRLVGAMPRYVGREPRRLPDGSVEWPATRDPHVHDTDTMPHEHTLRLVTRCQRGELWPADAETAEFCRVRFVELTFVAEGAWVPRPKSLPTQAAFTKESLS